MATKANNRKSDTTSDASALRRRQERRKNRGNGAVADWSSCDSELLQGLVSVLTLHKGTITFGYTRDGGAYYVNFYINGESIKEYIRPTEDIDAWLEEEITAWS